MSRLSQKLFAVAAFAVAVVLLPAAADDKDKPTDWSKFATAGNLVGEIVKADDAGLTLRISWQVPSNASLRGRRGGRPVQGKEQHVDYDLKYADGGLARIKTLPPKLDEKGKKIPPSSTEKEARKKPAGAPGYSLEKTELTPGHIVELTLVRSKDVSAAKATMDDLQVKYAVVVGESPTPPKVDRDDKKKEEKKKDDKKKEK